MSGSETVHQPLSAAARPYRVAIAGTVTNAATGDIVPQALVRITAAPAAFTEGVMALLAAAIASCPSLQAHYRNLIEAGQRALNPLGSVQGLLDRLGPPLGLTRLDQTQSGGDGHYCFYDLPAGCYTLTATCPLAHGGQGMTSIQVEVLPSDCRLSFAAVDLALSLAPEVCPLTELGDRSTAKPLAHAASVWPAPAAPCPRVETLSR